MVKFADTFCTFHCLLDLLIFLAGLVWLRLFCWAEIVLYGLIWFDWDCFVWLGLFCLDWFGLTEIVLLGLVSSGPLHLSSLIGCCACVDPPVHQWYVHDGQLVRRRRKMILNIWCICISPNSIKTKLWNVKPMPRTDLWTDRSFYGCQSCWEPWTRFPSSVVSLHFHSVLNQYCIVLHQQISQRWWELPSVHFHLPNFI